jgi:glycogen synthase kinase 3 beta
VYVRARDTKRAELSEGVYPRQEMSDKMDQDGPSRRRTTTLADPALAETISQQDEHDPLTGALHGMNVKDDATMTKVKATVGFPETNSTEVDIAFSELSVIGNGSFGVVFKTTLVHNGISRGVALTKVLQDRRYKNRELEIMRMVKHVNITELLFFFFTPGQKPDDTYLNLVMEFLPTSLSAFAESYNKRKSLMPILYIKLSIYQMLRALAYLHGRKICHRDIKPQNLLLNAALGVLKLCDFGCAKILAPDQPNVSYICSRYYRAPELCFGAQLYSHAIDVWSAGCVLAELLMGTPIFRGSTSSDQLLKIVRIMGSPTREQTLAMNPAYDKATLPAVPAKRLDEVFRARPAEERDAAVSLCKGMFDYTPTKRFDTLQSMAHPFFDELRNPNTRLSSGNPLPQLFDFTPEELSVRPSLQSALMPAHARV